MLPRHATARVLEALGDTRVVTVEGPRQAGKSTLCAGVAAAHGFRSVTLDDAAIAAAAREDPTGYRGPRRACVYRRGSASPGAGLAVKAEVDRHPTPGRFLLSGSANLLLAPRIGDSLAGRVERVPLRPFTQAEREGTGVPTWLDGLWDGGEPPYVETDAVGRAAHAERIAAGGFPAVLARSARRPAGLDRGLPGRACRP